MAICINSRCAKSVPDDSIFCPYCGGKEISKVISIVSPSVEQDEISIENFHKVIENSTPAPEPLIETNQPNKTKASFGSRFAVRARYFRKKFPSRPQQGWRPGQNRRRKIFITVGVLALLVIVIL